MELPAIIAVGYSRVQGFRRLLGSINNAAYPGEGCIKLVLSLDGGADWRVVDIAKQFQFKHGTCEVIIRDRNLGVREHLLWCGDQTRKYGAVIVLEDDLVVDPHFYAYAVAAQETYGEDRQIAGIALYSPAYNEYAHLPFIPRFSGFSCYFMQVVCSWGQLWNRGQWDAFRRWYDRNGSQDAVDRCEKLPDRVKRWPESAWDKYFCAYLAACDRYFIYPYRSYTTNFNDPGGQHSRKATNRFQVPMADPLRPPDRFRFEPFPISKNRFDAFMEPEPHVIGKFFELAPSEVEIDVYGLKPLRLLRRKTFCLTTRRVTNPVKRFSLRIVPYELNLLYPDSRSGMTWMYLCRSVDVRKETIIQLHMRRFKLAAYFARLPFRSKWFFISYVADFLTIRLIWKMNPGIDKKLNP